MTHVRKQLLLGHSFWGRGGAEVAAMWILQSLCRDYRVDIVTRGGWDLDDLNRCAGTSVRPGDLGRIRYTPLTPKTNTQGGAFWHGLFLRYCRRIAGEYDLCITASRIIDWGVPAIHFLSDVVWNPTLQERFRSSEWLSKYRVLRKLYFKLGTLVAGRSGRVPARHDRLVANSKWTAEISAPFCTQSPVVIYPAVPGKIAAVPGPEREDSFLCLGRISPEKQIEQVIAILEQVRALGHPVRLHFVGQFDVGAYGRKIMLLCEARRDWITLHGPLYGEEKLRFFSRCRFGISACEREAFGIATAEMLKAGLLTFVPRNGAQAEIVRETSLVYANQQDAVTKIAALLRSQACQVQLHHALLKQVAELDPENFCTAVRELVAKALPGGPCPSGPQLSRDRCYGQSAQDFATHHLSILYLTNKIQCAVTYIFYWLGVSSLFYFLNRNRKRILSYHNVLPDNLLGDHLCEGNSHRLSIFRRQLQYLRTRFQCGTDLDDTRQLVITFDDGYDNQLAIVHPVLAEFGIKACFFLSINLIESEHPLLIDELLGWLSYVEAGTYELALPGESAVRLEISDAASRYHCWVTIIYPRILANGVSIVSIRDEFDRLCPFSQIWNKMDGDYRTLRYGSMTRAGIATLQAYGHKIGAHSKSHLVLSVMDDAEAQHEFTACQQEMNKLFDMAALAYPFGGVAEVSPRDIKLAQAAGFAHGLSNINSPLPLGRRYSRHFLPRMGLPDRAGVPEMAFILSGAKYFLKYCRLLPKV